MQTVEIIPCPICNSIMAATQNERGAFFICGHCGHEVPINDRGTVEE